MRGKVGRGHGRARLFCAAFVITTNNIDCVNLIMNSRYGDHVLTFPVALCLGVGKSAVSITGL